MADTDAELHAFAARLGMRREWFQHKPNRPHQAHYDVPERARPEALALGAVPVTWRQLGRMLRDRRTAPVPAGPGPAPTPRPDLRRCPRPAERHRARRSADPGAGRGGHGVGRRRGHRAHGPGPGAAAADAGPPPMLAAVDRIAVPQGNWSYPDPARLVADPVGASRARTHLAELGIPQQVLINEALAAIAAGASEVAVVVGGEARRWARRRPDAGDDETSQPGRGPDVVHRRPGPLLEPVEEAHRLWDPVQQYAMIDNALRAAEEQSPVGPPGRDRRALGPLQPGGPRQPRRRLPRADGRVGDRLPPPAGNRPLAFPYNKWHATQWTVDQAAALVFCSVEAATRLGVGADRWVHPLVGLHSSHAVSLLRSPPAARLAGHGRAGRRGRRPDRASRGRGRARRGLQLLSGRGPGAAARPRPRRRGHPDRHRGHGLRRRPVQQLRPPGHGGRGCRAVRARPGALGVVTTVSGLLTKPGIGAWSARPDGRPPLLADLARSGRGRHRRVDVVETLEGYQGGATVVTYTVAYDGLDPVRTLALCDTDDGRRCVALSDDADLAARAIDRGDWSVAGCGSAGDVSAVDEGRRPGDGPTSDRPATVGRGPATGRGLRLRGARNRGVLVTLRRWPAPAVEHHLPAGGDHSVRISVTDDRAKTRIFVVIPRASLYVSRDDFFAYVVLEGEVSLTQWREPR